MAPPKILVAQDEDMEKQNAKLIAQHDEDEKKMEAQEEEKKKLESKLAAQEKEIPATPGPVVKAIIAGMDKEHMEEAKKAIRHAMDEEHDEAKKAEMEKDLKAMEEVFETGNGVNTNAQEDKEKEETKTAMKALTAKVAKPIINKILSAKTAAGATEDQIKDETKRLAAMTLPEIELEYKTNEVFIDQALTAQIIEEDSAALTARYEKEFEFNGIEGLTAKVTDIDEMLESAAQ